MNRTQIKRRRIGAYTAVVVALAVAVLIAVNLIVGELPTRYVRFDTSELGYYELSEYTEKTISEVSEQVTVYHIAQQQNRDPILAELLARYAQGNANITLQQIDPAFHPDFTVQYTQEVLEDNAVIVTSARRTKIVRYADVMRTEDVIDTETGEEGSRSVFCGETAITGAVQYVTAQRVPTVCMVIGHDEGITDALLADIEYGGFTYTEIYLSDGIPDDCDCLLINSPDTDYTQDEISVLRTYLNDGGKLLFTSPVYAVSAPGLAALMKECGAQASMNSVITETNGSYYLNGDTHALKPQLEPSVLLNRTGSGIFTVMYAAHPITHIAAEGWTYTPLMTTSSGAYITADGTRYTGPYQVAVLLQNTRGGQVIWFSTPAIWVDAYDALCSGGNFKFYLAALDELCQKETSVTVASKVMQVEALNVTTTATTIWTVVLVGIIPAAVLAAGAGVWYRRKNRQ